ncbi:MAG: glutathione S-transferase N-terminal domain-containing protein [Alphaproteobacteria bacterium]|jgi:glutathione S-transferase|tara:strand:- start:9523 stop:10182 length:660 start_codon:yes stop_codon:yes gene_type:complete
MITLYELSGKNDVRFSPYCWRARMALNYKNLDFKTVPIKFTEKNLIEFSGQKLLPIMVDNDIVVTDSWNIACYLDKKYLGNKNLFMDAELNFDHFVNQWADKMLNGAIIKIVINDITKHLDTKDKDYFIKSRSQRFGISPKDMADKSIDSLNQLYKYISFLNSILEKQEFISGDSIGYSDFVIAGSLKWGKQVTDVDLIDKNNTNMLIWYNKIENLFMR